jgi:hypothetical protein
MSDFPAMLLMVLSAAVCVWWQRSLLKRQLTAGQDNALWYPALSKTGAMISAVLVLNGVSYLKLRGIEFSMVMAQDVVLSDGTIAEPSQTDVLVGQLEVMLATLSLVVLVWETIRRTSGTLEGFNQAAQVQVLVAVAGKLMVPFWLATIGIGSVFGVSSGFGLKDVVRHTELLIGPPLVMSLELTLFWIVGKVIVSKKLIE